uniref:Uncharacterized protein n=1 Tax=Oryza nivara TaxID=4536 RepID=A0A0E0GSE6_ORYNI
MATCTAALVASAMGISDCLVAHGDDGGVVVDVEQRQRAAAEEDEQRVAELVHLGENTCAQKKTGPDAAVAPPGGKQKAHHAEGAVAATESTHPAAMAAESARRTALWSAETARSARGCGDGSGTTRRWRRNTVAR